MARCTAPVEGHRSSSAAAACPACRGSYGRRYGGYSGYGSGYSSSYSSGGSNGNSYSSGGRSSGGGGSRPSWSRASSAVSYTPAQVVSLTPVREAIEREAATRPDLRDCFLCHAWDDRRGAATELHDLLEAEGVSVWFSERDIVLGQPFMREVDRGLAKSRTGLVLVTPALLKRVTGGGVSDKELSALLRRDLLIPVVHGTTYDELERVSPLLASRNGLNTADDSMADIAVKIAELVALDSDALLTQP